MMTLTEESPDLERKSLTEYIRTHTITEEEQERAIRRLQALRHHHRRCPVNSHTRRQEAKAEDLQAPSLTYPYAVRYALHGPGGRRPAFYHPNAPLARKPFFSGKKRASIDETYNDNASRGSAKRAALMARHDALERSYLKFMEENKL